MAVSLDSALSSLISNKRRVSALKSLGITTVGDALTYYPFRLAPAFERKSISQILPGQFSAFAAVVATANLVNMGRGRGYRLEVSVDDSEFAPACAQEPAATKLVFFSHKKPYMDWMSARLQVGSRVVVAGQAAQFMDQLQFTHPEILTVGHGQTPGGPRPDVLSIEEALDKVTRPRPVYHANSRISSEHIHDTILAMLQGLAGVNPVEPAHPPEQDQPSTDEIDPQVLGQAVPDILPETVRAAGNFLHRGQAFLYMHRPASQEEYRQAHRTLRFEEAFVSQTALLRSREKAQQLETYVCPQPGPDSVSQRFVKSLPFTLTQGQEEVIGEISSDLARSYPMQRLLEGEVGSGKTVVALTAMLQAVDAGYQAVLVAPTQVLAEQHFESIAGMLTGLSGDQQSQENTGNDHIKTDTAVPLILLTGGMRLAERRQALAIPASGQSCIVVATHAAFSKTFQAPHLALAVIDEQHRFGVEQRETLRSKSEKSPHLLVMTATPIPRTAAMTWFGDLDISQLSGLPGGRKPIQTRVIPESDPFQVSSLFAGVRSHVLEGERAYIVCPRIDDDSDNDSSGAAKAQDQGELADIDPYGADDEGSGSQTKPPLHSVEEITRRLRSLPQLEGIDIGSLTGRDDDETKNAVMADFASGRTPVLVATTVIEVGVDVPEATIIVIFDADRFGLSQLHQLRGRVGRGDKQGWAFLISRAEADSPAAQRMEIIRSTTDGAKIAEADIDLRGVGDVLGDMQSGKHSSLKLLRVVRDSQLIQEARKQAQELLQADPELKGAVQLAGAALDFMSSNETFLTST